MEQNKFLDFCQRHEAHIIGMTIGMSFASFCSPSRFNTGCTLLFSILLAVIHLYKSSMKKKNENSGN